MSRRHKHRNKNKVRAVLMQKHDEGGMTENVKPRHEIWRDEDYTDEEMFESIKINCAHMLMSLMDDDEDDLSMSYDEIVELLKAASELEPHIVETKNKDKRP